jgi:hypothetical protein
LKPRRVTQKPRLDLRNGFYPLPSHGHA